MSSHSDPRISCDQLARKAIVYVRQSSVRQVRNNTESTRLQWDLASRAVELGWPAPLVIDDDLGLTASGFADRPGFQRLLAAVALRQVGIVFCFDVSRLSRNDKDWAHLLELCGFFDTLIGDPDQIYNLSQPNDRLLLGIKGSVAAMELTLIRNRLNSGREAKAARGELKFNLPPGYCHAPDGRIAFDPDRRIQHAIRLMFGQFQRIGTLRQLLKWYRETNTLFPVRKGRPNAATTSWQFPNYQTLRNHLVSPIYAGIYAWGTTRTITEFIDGQLTKRVREAPESEWRVRLPEHHPAYISLEQFMENRARLAENSARWSMKDNRGAVRDGLALLTGLLRCARCGARLGVSYKPQTAVYFCKRGESDGSSRCLMVGAKALDEGVTQELLRVLSPLAIEAAAQAHERRDREQQQLIEAARLNLESARYAADRAFQQYDSVDPKNRLVADTLEQRLNEKLSEVKQAELELEHRSVTRAPLSTEQRAALVDLGRDLPAVWTHGAADPKIKKTLLRTAIQEITLEINESASLIEMTIHWAGGVHSRCSVSKRRQRPKGRTDPEIIEKIKQLSTEFDDREVARILSAQGLATAHELCWTAARVRELKRVNKIHGRPSPPDPDLLSFTKAQEYLGISGNGILGLVKRGVINPNRITDFAPWRVPREQLDSPKVQRLVSHLKEHGRLPKGDDSEAQKGLFPDIPPSL